jgi:L-alanine-DL-glutamate epimerase-like enolase superfamily enzyme
MTQLSIEHISSPLAREFSISRGAKNSAETVRVLIERDGQRGRGESVPYSRYGETIESVIEAIETRRVDLEAGLSREDLQNAMPAGAARCALDCALWDLDAKLSDRPVWKLAGLPEPTPLETAVTIVLADVDEMVAAAQAAASTLLKLKLGGADDLARVKAVHEARPDGRLILDGNEGLDPGAFPEIARQATRLGVVLIEQPFPAGKDKYLPGRPPEVAICADESAHTRDQIQTLVRSYDVVNVKLDKTGGLTGAIAMVKEARAAGMGVMVGCMVAGSLSMAPAVLLGGLADAVDLDGPLWLADDIEDGLTFSGGAVHPPLRELWG